MSMANKLSIITAITVLCAACTSIQTSTFASCPYQAGQSKPAIFHNIDIPIDHIIVVMQENRSFDHYFQKLPEYGQPHVEVAPANTFNLDNNGKKIFLTRADTPCLGDEPHYWNKVNEQIAGGAMNGFVTAGGAGAMTYYDESWIPYYYALANTFAIADHYHASVPSSTWPNRMYMIAGSSFGHILNDPPPPRVEERSIFHQLEQTGKSWAVFTAADPSFEERILPRLRAEKGDHFRTIDDFLEIAKKGKLPDFSWVTSAGRHNEHPPKNIQAGQKFVAQIIDAVMKSPNWQRTALFFTYDEHGGFYDHVAPPKACSPDDIQPILESGDVPGKFDRLGVRVPMIVISPYAKKHYVSHTVYDHTSILRFIQMRFNLPVLTARDAHATPPIDMFDFKHSSFTQPPVLPTANEDPRFVNECEDTARARYSNEAAIGK
ncbi:MAG TPA: alkaline phosphatase family protein [Methylobacter sp.]